MRLPRVRRTRSQDVVNNSQQNSVRKTKLVSYRDENRGPRKLFVLALVDAVVLGKDATLSEVFAALWARIGFLTRMNARVLKWRE